MKKKLYNRMNKNNTFKVVLITLMCISVASYVIYYLTANNDSGHELTLNNLNKIEKINVENTNDKKKKIEIVYLFYLPTCGYCHRAMSYIETNLKNKYKNIEFKYVNVALKDGRDLYFKLKKELNIVSNGVPVAVIGNKYLLGFGDTTGDEYVKVIKAEILNKK